MLRSILALLLLATVGVSAYANALSFQWMADRARDLATDVFQGEDGDADSTMPMKKKKGGPKRRASYDRYEMEGVYTIHVAREGEDLETAGTR